MSFKDPWPQSSAAIIPTHINPGESSTSDEDVLKIAAMIDEKQVPSKSTSTSDIKITRKTTPPSQVVNLRSDLVLKDLFDKGYEVL